MAPSSNLDKKQLIANALSKFDFSFKELIDVAPLAAVYHFNKIDHKWEKTNHEGSLFIYKTHEGSCNTLLLNRFPGSHFLDRIIENSELHVEGNFIIYESQTNNKINGIWIHGQDNHERIWNNLNNTINGLKLLFGKVKKQTDEQIDVVRMLTKAKTQYKYEQELSLDNFTNMPPNQQKEAQSFNEISSPSVAQFFMMVRRANGDA